MPEPGKSDRWNSLLETLGVPVGEPKPAEPAGAPPAGEPAPATAKTQPMSFLRPEKKKPAAAPKSGPPAAKSPSYWSRIAGALGLEVPAAPEPPLKEEPKIQRTEEPKVHRTEEPKARELPPRAFERPAREVRPAREERPGREERPPREERHPREERPRPSEPSPRSALDDMFGSKPADVDVFGLGVEAEAPRAHEPSARDERAAEESGSVIDYDVPQGSGSDLSLGEAPPMQRGAAREEEEREGRRPRRRRRGRGRRSAGEAREPAAPRHEGDIEPAGEEADFDFERDEELDLDAEMPPESDSSRQPPERGARHERGEEPEEYPAGGERSRRDRADERGRRPPRRRRRDGRAAGEADTGRPARYAEDEPGRFGPPHEARPAAARPPRDVEEEPFDELLDEGDEGEEGQGGDVPTHKKIPTWEEAVGILIDANMANRGPERGRGRGRGRR